MAEKFDAFPKLAIIKRKAFDDREMYSKFSLIINYSWNLRSDLELCRADAVKATTRESFSEEGFWYTCKGFFYASVFSAVVSLIACDDILASIKTVPFWLLFLIPPVCLSAFTVYMELFPYGRIPGKKVLKILSQTGGQKDKIESWCNFIESRIHSMLETAEKNGLILGRALYEPRRWDETRLISIPDMKKFLFGKKDLDRVLPGIMEMESALSDVESMFNQHIANVCEEGIPEIRKDYREFLTTEQKFDFSGIWEGGR